MPFPHVVVRGGARERGRQYGRQAAGRVRRSITLYRDVFEHYAGWDWATVVRQAGAFVAPVEAFDARYVEEMRGIAEGAEVPFEDVLAINVRTEVMFAAKARAAAARQTRPGECTSFASAPVGGPVLVGQNWDWLPQTSDTVVVLTAEQDEGPTYTTVVEAGLLAKCGLNSAGLGLGANALVSSEDDGRPGVPFHVLLRALLDVETAGDALATLQRADRASSAHYLLAHRDGLALGVEARPGGIDRLHLLQPSPDGLLLHTNHFLHDRFDATDVGTWLMPDSPFRLQRVGALAAAGNGLDATGWERVLADHAGHPFGVCAHPDPRDHPLDQGATVAGVVMDLTAGTLRLASGTPCTEPFLTVDLPAPQPAPARSGTA